MRLSWSGRMEATRSACCILRKADTRLRAVSMKEAARNFFLEASPAIGSKEVEECRPYARALPTLVFTCLG